MDKPHESLLFLAPTPPAPESALLMPADLSPSISAVALEAWEPKREVIHAVYPSRRGLLPSVRALVDFLTEEYARMVEE